MGAMISPGRKSWIWFTRNLNFSKLMPVSNIRPSRTLTPAQRAANYELLMTLITLFSAPKPFTDPHIAMIQRNAIKSWTLLSESDVEVILLGEETGLAEAARELGVKYIPNVK